jgi:hypothetical protein
MKQILIAVAAILLSGGALSADILYSNLGTPTGTDPGWDPFDLGDLSGWAVDASGPVAQAMPFQPSETATYDGVVPILNCFDICNSDYTVQILSDNGGKPGTVLDSIDELGQTLAFDGSEFVPASTHPLLIAGQTYWLNVFEKPSTDMYTILWRLNETGDPGTPQVSSDFGQTWTNSVDLFAHTETPGAFEIVGTAVSTPEPSSALLLAAGLVLAVIFWRIKAL